MREIKFRAWMKDSKLMIEDVVPIHNEVYGHYCKDLERDTDKYLKLKNSEIMQYTGLKDRNGKEIFEGDIVAFEDSDGGYEYPDVVVNTGIVEYGELGFYFTNRVAAEMDDFYIKDGRCDDVEVIGNIYENAELLEEQ